MTAHWIDLEDGMAAAFFDELPTSEIRRRQDVCRAQQMVAFERKDNDALTDLQCMETALLAAMLRRV